MNSTSKAKRKEYSRRYYERHYEQLKEYLRKYREEHRDYFKEQARRYYAQNREKLLEQGKKRQQKDNWERKIKLINLLGDHCRMCACSDPRVLQINHRNGGGVKEFRRNPGMTFYRKILSGERTIDDLELLCANCNLIYEYEQGKRYKYVNTKHIQEASN